MSKWAILKNPLQSGEGVMKCAEGFSLTSMVPPPPPPHRSRAGATTPAAPATREASRLSASRILELHVEKEIKSNNEAPITVFLKHGDREWPLDIYVSWASRGLEAPVRAFRGSYKCINRERYLIKIATKLHYFIFLIVYILCSLNDVWISKYLLKRGVIIWCLDD